MVHLLVTSDSTFNLYAAQVYHREFKLKVDLVELYETGEIFMLRYLSMCKKIRFYVFVLLMISLSLII